MADQTLTRVTSPGQTVETRRRAERQQRRNLRIAIRQLERAELYVVAAESLVVADPIASEKAEDVTRRLRTLEHYLVHLKLGGLD